MTKQVDGLPDESSDRFNCVESVASQIFDRMPHLENEDAALDGGAETAPDGFGLGMERALPYSGASSRDNGSVFVRTEKLLTSLLHALDEREHGADGQNDVNAGDVQRPPDFAKSPDISFHAANRRAQLPFGIEILQGKPGGFSETQTLSSISVLMEQQSREQASIRLAEKREFNRKALPVLESQEAFDEPEFADQQVNLSLPSQCIMRLKRRFRGEYFLIFSLSGWSTLALMVFIDPGLSTALCFFSLFLLFVSYCLFSDKYR